MQPQRIEFNKIKELHKAAQSMPGSFAGMDLPTFSAAMQEKLPDFDFSQGQQPDNFVGSYSRGVDRLLAATGLPALGAEAIGAVGSGVDSLIGNTEQRFENVGRGVGESLPRGLAQVGTLIGGAALTATGVGAPAGAALMAAGAADAGAKGYADTGSVKQGLISAALTRAAPGLGQVGTKAGLGALNKIAPRAAANPLARFGAVELGQEATFGAAHLGGDLLAGRGLVETFSAENLFATVTGNLAFQPISIRNSIREARAGAKAAAEEFARPEVGESKPAVAGYSEYEKALGIEPDKFFDYLTNPNRQDDVKRQKALVEFERKMNPEFDEAKAVTELFEMVGVNSESVLPRTMETLAQIDKAGRVIQRGAITGEMHAELVARTAALLAESPNNVVSLINLVKANNELTSALPDVIQIPSAQQRGKIQKRLARESEIESDRRFERHRAEMEGEQARLKNRLGLEAPNFSDPEVQARYFAENEQFGMPSRTEADVLGRDRKLGDNAAKLKMKRKVEEEKFRKGKIRPNALQERSARPEFKKLEAESDIFRFAKGNLGTVGGRITMIGKTNIGATGLINENRFLKETQMPKEVFALVKQVYPEAFEGQNVNVHRLRELEQERPMFETDVYGMERSSAAEREKALMHHEWYDNLTDTQRDLVDGYVRGSEDSEESITGYTIPDLRDAGIDTEKVKRWSLLAAEGDFAPKSESVATAAYRDISPFDTVKYPPIRIDIRLPKSKDGVPRFKGDREQGGVHDYDDTLGWFMVQFVPHPKTGETVMFVAEGQSRWAQEKGRTDKQSRSFDFDETSRKQWSDEVTPNHPLLDHQHKLAMKAAMDEARKRGVTKMVVSDGETAMMTERHDTSARAKYNLEDLGKWQARDVPNKNSLSGSKFFNTREEAVAALNEFKNNVKPQYELEVVQISKEDVTPKPEQAGGMRQHYDSVLQSAAEKMTKSKGEVVDMGVHKNAVEKTDMRVEDPSSLIKGSPVFRNPDGTPKTSATGKIYDITPDVVDSARYSKNPNIDSSTLARAYSLALLSEQNNPSQAMLRLGEQLKGQLEANVNRADPNFVQSAENFVRESLRRKGLDGRLADEYVAQAVRILSKLGVNPQSQVSAISDPAYQARVNPKLNPTDQKELAKGDTVGAAIPVGPRGQTEVGVKAELTPRELILTLVHESLHAVHSRAASLTDGVDSYRNKVFNEALDYVKNLDVDTRVELLDRYYRDLGIEQKFREGATKYATKTETEFVIDIAAAAAIRADNRATAETLRWLPEPIRRAVVDMMRTIKEMVETVSLHLSFNGKEKGKIQEMNKFLKNLDELVKPDVEIQKAMKVVEGAIKARSLLEENVGLDGVQFKKVTAGGERSLFEWLTGNTRDDMGAMGFVGRNLAQLQQSAASIKYRTAIPSFQEAIGLLTTMTGKSKEYKQQFNFEWMIDIGGGIMRDLRFTKDGKLNPAQLQQKNDFLRVKESAKLTELYSKMTTKSNELTQLASKLQEPYPDVNHPEIKKLMQDFSAEDQTALRRLFEADLKRNRIVGNAEVDARFKAHSIDMANIFLSSGLPHDQARRAGSEMIERLFKNNILTPEELAQPGVQKAFNYWSRISESFGEFMDSRDRPYFSEMRTGTYLIKFETDELDDRGRVMTDARSANSVQEAAAIVKDLQSKGVTIIQDKGKNWTDRRNREYNEFDVLPTYLIERARNLEAARYEALVGAAEPELAQKMREVYVGGEALGEQAASRRGSSNVRKFKPARENINMLNNQEAYINIMANKISRQVQRGEFNWQMRHEDWKKDSRLQNEVQEFGHNVLNSGKMKFQGMRNAVIVSMMGFNVSSALIDSTQALTMGVHRAAEFVSYGKAYGYVKDGYREAFRKNPKDSEFQTLLAKVDSEGLLITGSRMEEFVTMDDYVGFNLSRQSDGMDLVSYEDALTNKQFMAGKVNDMFKRFTHYAVKGAMLPTSLSAQINNKTMLYVGYRTGKELGYSGQKLYEFARSMMQTTNVGGGRAAQSSFKLKAGKANELVGLSTLLTNYPVAAISHMVSSYQSMLGSSGLPLEARKKAAKVFTGQLLTQLAFAGSLGVGLDVVFALLQETLGIDAESELREALLDFDESGMVGDVVLNGVMDQLTQMNMSSRYTLSGLAGLNGYTGFDARGIFGAAGSFWSNAYQLPGQLKDDVDLSKIGMVPTGVKSILSSMEDTFTDRNGQTLIDPTELERIQRFVGFRPKRLSDVQDQRATMRNADNNATRARQGQNKQMMALIDEGNLAAVQEMVQAEVAEELSAMELEGMSEEALIAQSDKMMRSRLMSLIESKVDKGLPVDPLREGNTNSAAARSKAAKGYGELIAPRTNEEKRLEMKTNLVEAFGLEPKRGQPRAVQMARLIDQIIDENPTITRQEANLMAREMLRGGIQ